MYELTLDDCLEDDSSKRLVSSYYSQAIHQSGRAGDCSGVIEVHLYGQREVATADGSNGAGAGYRSKASSAASVTIWTARFRKPRARGWNCAANAQALIMSLMKSA